MSRDALDARIDAAVYDLKQAETILKSRGIEDLLRDGVQGRCLELVRSDFLHRVDQHRRKFENDRRELVSGVAEEAIWAGFGGHAQDANLLLRECLAFVQGALLRVNGVDGGLCDAADLLLGELSEQAEVRWARFSLIADGESFSDLSAVIHLRFPASTVWDLPVTAHEFGHFVIDARAGVPGLIRGFQDLRSSVMVQAVSDRNQISFGSESMLEEFFADSYATWTLGPAYACTCLRLRFNPARVNDQPDQDSHPPYGERAYLITRLLELMLRHPLGGYEGVVASTKHAWERSIAAAARGASSQLATQKLDRLAYLLHELLLDSQRRARYDRWPVAQGMAAKLISAPGTDQVGPEDTAVDVLNAAWLARLQVHPKRNAYEISLRARELLRQIAVLRTQVAT